MSIYTDDGFTHLDNDEDKLVSGSINGEVVAWDFNTGKPLCTLNAQHRVVCLKVKWPFVVTCATNLYKSVFKTVTKESAKGVKIFNMMDQTLIRHIPCGKTSDVNIHGNVLLVCERLDYDAYKEHYQNPSHLYEQDKTVRFWNFDQLTDSSLNEDKIVNRKIPSPLDVREWQVSAMVGSSVWISEDNKLIQRNFSNTKKNTTVSPRLSGHKLPRSSQYLDQ